MLAITTPGARSSRVSAVFILWWCLAFHLVDIGNSIWSIWSVYNVLGQPASAFPDFFWQVMSEEPFLYGYPAVLVAIAALWLAAHHRFLTPRKAARWTPMVCITLLILTLVIPLIGAILDEIA